MDLEGKPFFLTDVAGGRVNVCLMLCFVSWVCLCVSTFTVFKYIRHKEKYQPFLGLFFKNYFIFYLCLNLTHESKAEGHLAISGLILGDGTWTDSLFSSLLQTHLPLAIPQLWFRRQAALAPSQFWIRLPCHYLVVAPTRVLCVRLSGALLPASQALQAGATHHRRPWLVDVLQLWQLCARMDGTSWKCSLSAHVCEFWMLQVNFSLTVPKTKQFFGSYFHFHSWKWLAYSVKSVLVYEKFGNFKVTVVFNFQLIHACCVKLLWITSEWLCQGITFYRRLL